MERRALLEFVEATLTPKRSHQPAEELRKAAVALYNDGLTMTRIGKRLGVTRQRIHQLTKGSIVPRKRGRPRRKALKPPNFHWLFLKWIRESGGFYCSCCKRVIAKSEIPHNARLCGDCNRDRARKYYRTPQGRECHRRYYRKHRKRILGRKRKRLFYVNRLKSDSEG